MEIALAPVTGTRLLAPFRLSVMSMLANLVSDFVPAAKLARREGTDVILDPLGQAVHDHLFEHIDGLRTPKKPAGGKQNRTEIIKVVETKQTLEVEAVHPPTPPRRLGDVRYG
jgi:hypothetical protein